MSVVVLHSLSSGGNDSAGAGDAAPLLDSLPNVEKAQPLIKLHVVVHD